MRPEGNPGQLNIEKIKSGLFNWRAALKSPNFVPLSIKLSLFLIFPIVTYFQDFVQVFSLALSDQEAQYVLLVPFVVAYFFYRRRKAFLVSRKNSKSQDLFGVSLLLLALLIYVLGSYSFYSLQLHLLSLPIFVAGVTLLIFGADTLKLLVFPIALVAFLSPFPLFFMDAYGGNLMSSDGALASSILKPFLPIGITYQPIVVLSTITAAGAKIQFSLDAACSGIYSLTAFLFCAVVFGYLASGSPIKKILYAALAVCAAYFLNVFRIITMVVLGHFWGLGLALEFFHDVAGTALAFVGTLILLYFGSKVLKLSFIQGKANVCSFCKNSQTICDKCGRILHWPKTKIDWRRMAIVLLFLLICSDLIVQAAAVNYNVVAKGDESALNFNPSTGELAAFSNATGWSAAFLGRETQAEQELGLIFVGDYLLTQNSSSNTVYAIFEVSNLQSQFHTWEGCLNYQAYPINIEKITDLTIYDQNDSIVNGEEIIANAPTLNQTLDLVYWFDSLNLETNGTITNYAVKITLLKYVTDINNQTAQAMNIQAATTQLFSLSQAYENIWGQFKISNSTFVIDIYRNQEASTIFVAIILIFSIATLTGKKLLMRVAARKKIAALPEADKTLLKQLKNKQFENPDLPQGNANHYENKIEEFRQNQILYQKISAINDEIYVEWVPY
ncbi:MAG: exosortase/archaeosortase family protein [Candidatus Bathyarchaeia archaeon]